MRNNHDTPSTSPWDAFSAALDENASEPLDTQSFETETLVAYHRGRLGSVETAQIQRQLAASPAMVAELLDLAAFATPTADDRAPLSPTALDAAWSTFEAHAFGADANEASPDKDNSEPAPVIDFATARRPQRRTVRRWWVAAAAAVLAVVGWRAVGPNEALAPADTTASGVFVASFENGALDSEWALTESRPATAGRTLLDARFENGAMDTEWTVAEPEPRGTDAPLLHNDFEPEAGQLDGWQIVGPAANLEA